MHCNPLAGALQSIRPDVWFAAKQGQGVPFEPRPLFSRHGGMPARRYVIDARGAVAYNNGRAVRHPNRGMDLAFALTLLDGTLGNTTHSQIGMVRRRSHGSER